MHERLSRDEKGDNRAIKGRECNERKRREGWGKAIGKREGRRRRRGMREMRGMRERGENTVGREREKSKTKAERLRRWVYRVTFERCISEGRERERERERERGRERDQRGA
jgi:hypothetical protein